MDVNNLVEVVLKESRKDEVTYKTSALESLGDILLALKIDKFDEVYHIVQDILAKDSTRVDKDDDDDMSGDEISKRREANIKLREVIYDTLGKSWPDNSKSTQEKYRDLFVEHCNSCLPTTTRGIQVCVMTALNCFVDKLLLLQENDLSSTDKQELEKITDKILIILQYSLSNYYNIF